jgi:hypothetical protein
MAIGKVFAPGDVHICDTNKDDRPGCATDQSSLSLVVTWLEPVQTGAGAELALPISRYEVVLSEDNSFSIAVRTVNISSANAQGEGRVCRIEIPDLPKGRSFVARVRGYNQVGPGEWGETLGAPRVFALAGSFVEKEISPLYHTGECPADAITCVLPVNANIHLQYRGAGALTDVVVTIDVYPKNITTATEKLTGLVHILLCNTTFLADATTE